MKNMYDCPKFLTCSANICPLYDKEYGKRSWFMEEETCTRKEVKNHPVIVAQRWLKKRYERRQRTVKVLGKVKHVSEETVFYGSELNELGKYLLKKRQECSERAKRLGYVQNLRRHNLNYCCRLRGN